MSSDLSHCLEEKRNIITDTGIKQPCLFILLKCSKIRKSLWIKQVLMYCNVYGELHWQWKWKPQILSPFWLWLLTYTWNKSSAEPIFLKWLIHKDNQGRDLYDVNVTLIFLSCPKYCSTLSTQKRTWDKTSPPQGTFKKCTVTIYKCGR